MVLTWAVKKPAVLTTSSITTRCSPSTNTLTVPSGSLRSCKMRAEVPISNKSEICGSSTAALFWATTTMALSVAMACSNASIEF